MASIFGRAVREQPLPRLQDVEEKLFASATLSKGMISNIDKADIPNEALTWVQNGRVRFDKTSRRPGRKLYILVKPNSSRIVRLFDLERGSTSRVLLRATTAGVHYSDGVVWTALAGPVLVGSVDIPAWIVNVLDTIILANGINRLQKIDLNNNTITDLSSKAPIARYVTGAFNRVVAASTGESGRRLVTVAWSGDGNLSEFDPLKDPSAGSSPIIDSPGDVADFITGIFGFDNLLVLVRKHSLWLATKQPSAINPFNFFNAFPGLGSNIPGSIAGVQDGIAFLDLETEDAWHYAPGQSPRRIGGLVRNEIFKSMSDPAKIFSGGYRKGPEYLVGVPQSGGTVKIWIHNFINESWAFDEVPDATAVLSVGEFSDYTSFDELTGTFDALVGTFDGLSVTPKETQALYVARSDGDIHVEDALLVQDNLVNYTFDARSKEFKFPREDITFTKLLIEYEAQIAGSITILYSKDGGQTWVTAKTISTTVGGSKLIKFTKNIKTRRLMWRLTATDGTFGLLNYEVYVSAGGEQSK